MFFVAAKIFWILANPLGLSIVLTAVALVLMMIGWRRLAATAATLVFLILALSAWTSIGALMLHPLEHRFARPEPAPERVAGIVVLGGGFEGAINRARGGFELNKAGDRFVEAAMLARRYPQARVLVTGGSGSLILEGATDAETATAFYEALGVAADRLMLEGEARDTYENAVFSKRLVDPKPGETWLLVTSAFHMPRSVALFEKVDFPVTPWPVDYRTAGDERFGFAQDNAIDSLQNVAVATREWIGLTAYYLAGRTDRLFP